MRKYTYYIINIFLAPHHSLIKGVVLFFVHIITQQNIYTVGENIIATIKMRDNFCHPLTMVIFPILRQRQQYWIFLYCSPFTYRSPNFAIAKVVALNLFASIFVCVCRLVHGFFSVLLPIQLSLFFALKGVSEK